MTEEEIGKLQDENLDRPRDSMEQVLLYAVQLQAYALKVLMAPPYLSTAQLRNIRMETDHLFEWLEENLAEFGKAVEIYEKIDEARAENAALAERVARGRSGKGGSDGD